MTKKSSIISAKQVKDSKRSKDSSRNVSKPQSVPGLRRLKQPGAELQQLLDDATVAESIEPFAWLRLQVADGFFDHLLACANEAKVLEVIGALPEPLQETLAQAFSAAPGTFEHRRAVVGFRYRDILAARELVHRLRSLFAAGEGGYIRRCIAPGETSDTSCGRWYFAGRHDKKGCSAICNLRIRKARWKKQFDKGNPKYHK